VALLVASVFLVLAGSTAVSAATTASSGPTSADDGAGRGPDPGPGPEPEVLTVSGPFTATGQLLGGCGTFRQVVDGEGEWSALGASTFHLDFCIQSPTTGVDYPVLDGGTFTITSAEGTLSGTLSGSVRAGGSPPPEVGFPFRFELAVTAGTGRFATATGAFVLEGAFGYGAVSAWGTISGTVSIPPGPPTSVADCRGDGWRDHVDDQGRPFRNQGQCIAFVLHRP
jgi:hypothetical protein